MKVKQDSTHAKAATPSVIGRMVSIFVPDDHPVMRLKQALDWEAIPARTSMVALDCPGLRIYMRRYWS